LSRGRELRGAERPASGNDDEGREGADSGIFAEGSICGWEELDPEDLDPVDLDPVDLDPVDLDPEDLAAVDLAPVDLGLTGE